MYIGYYDISERSDWISKYVYHVCVFRFEWFMRRRSRSSTETHDILCLPLTFGEDSRPGSDIQVQGRAEGERPQLWQPGEEREEQQEEQEGLDWPLVSHV